MPFTLYWDTESTGCLSSIQSLEMSCTFWHTRESSSSSISLWAIVVILSMSAPCGISNLQLMCDACVFFKVDKGSQAGICPKADPGTRDRNFQEHCHNPADSNTLRCSVYICREAGVGSPSGGPTRYSSYNKHFYFISMAGYCYFFIP